MPSGSSAGVINCDMIESEHHSNVQHSGRPWLDLILAGSAISISIVWLVISVQHGRTMENLVAANEVN